MYHYLFGASIMKSFRPFFTKHLLDTVSEFEFMIIHTFGVALILVVLFSYEQFINQNHTKIIKTIGRLSNYQIFCVFALSTLTVVSSLMVLTTYKFISSPVVNTMILKGVSTMTLLLIGTFVFRESYSLTQLIGAIIIVVGIIMVNSPDK